MSAAAAAAGSRPQHSPDADFPFALPLSFAVSSPQARRAVESSHGPGGYELPGALSVRLLSCDTVGTCLVTTAEEDRGGDDSVTNCTKTTAAALALADTVAVTLASEEALVMGFPRIAWWLARRIDHRSPPPPPPIMNDNEKSDNSSSSAQRKGGVCAVTAIVVKRVYELTIRPSLVGTASAAAAGGNTTIARRRPNASNINHNDGGHRNRASYMHADEAAAAASVWHAVNHSAALFAVQTLLHGQGGDGEKEGNGNGNGCAYAFHYPHTTNDNESAGNAGGDTVTTGSSSGGSSSRAECLIAGLRLSVFDQDSLADLLGLAAGCEGRNSAHLSQRRRERWWRPGRFRRRYAGVASAAHAHDGDDEYGDADDGDDGSYHAQPHPSTYDDGTVFSPTTAAATTASHWRPWASHQSLAALCLDHWGGALHRIDMLFPMVALTRLDLSHGYLARLSELEHCAFAAGLESVSVHGCRQLVDLSGLRFCPRLRCLDAADTPVVAVEWIRCCPLLEELSFAACRSLAYTPATLASLSTLRRLVALDLSFNHVPHLDWVVGCRDLEVLDVTGCMLLPRLPPALARVLPRLAWLRAGSSGLTGIGWLDPVPANEPPPPVRGQEKDGKNNTNSNDDGDDEGGEEGAQDRSRSRAGPPAGLATVTASLATTQQQQPQMIGLPLRELDLSECFRVADLRPLERYRRWALLQGGGGSSCPSSMVPSLLCPPPPSAPGAPTAAAAATTAGAETGVQSLLSCSGHNSSSCGGGGGQLLLLRTLKLSCAHARGGLDWLHRPDEAMMRSAPTATSTARTTPYRSSSSSGSPSRGPVGMMPPPPSASLRPASLMMATTVAVGAAADSLSELFLTDTRRIDLRPLRFLTRLTTLSLGECEAEGFEWMRPLLVAGKPSSASTATTTTTTVTNGSPNLSPLLQRSSAVDAGSGGGGSSGKTRIGLWQLEQLFLSMGSGRAGVGGHSSSNSSNALCRDLSPVASLPRLRKLLISNHRGLDSLAWLVTPTSIATATATSGIGEAEAANAAAAAATAASSSGADGSQLASLTSSFAAPSAYCCGGGLPPPPLPPAARSLEWLSIFGAPRLERIDAIAALPRLRHLHVVHTNLSSIDFLNNHHHHQQQHRTNPSGSTPHHSDNKSNSSAHGDCRGCGGEDQAHCCCCSGGGCPCARSLEVLNLSSSPRLTDITAVGHVRRLRILNVRNSAVRRLATGDRGRYLAYTREHQQQRSSSSSRALPSPLSSSSSSSGWLWLPLWSRYAPATLRDNENNPTTTARDSNRNRNGNKEAAEDVRVACGPARPPDRRPFHGYTSVAQCARLEALDLEGCAGLTDCAALSDLPSLRVLNLSFMHGLRDIQWIRGCVGLEALNLHGCPRLPRLIPGAVPAPRLPASSSSSLPLSPPPQTPWWRRWRSLLLHPFESVAAHSGDINSGSGGRATAATAAFSALHLLPRLAYLNGQRFFPLGALNTASDSDGDSEEGDEDDNE